MSANATTLANLLLTTIASTTECPHHKKMREDAAKLLANADHSKMDHSNHASHGEGAHNLHEGMIMNFHGGYNEVILFEFWNTANSLSFFLISCLALCIAAVLYEGLKFVREKLSRAEHSRRRQFLGSRICHCNIINSKEAQNDANSPMVDGTENSGVVKTCCCANENEASKPYLIRLLNKAHIMQTLLHMVQLTVSYLLMLVFMTYNSWLCLSIVLGSGLGYFLFGLKRLSPVDVNEHCH